MSNIDLESLKRLAEAATRGGWEVDGVRVLSASLPRNLIMTGSFSTLEAAAKDAAFIAAANPQTVLALIAEIKRLQRNMKENLTREAKDYNYLLAEKERIERELEEARKDAERYRHVRAKPEMLLHLSNSDFDAAIDAARQKQE